MGRDFKETSVNNINRKKFGEGYDGIFKKKAPEIICDKCQYNRGEQCTNESVMRIKDSRVVDCKINDEPIIACSYYKRKVKCKICRDTGKVNIEQVHDLLSGKYLCLKFNRCQCTEERLNDNS